MIYLLSYHTGFNTVSVELWAKTLSDMNQFSRPAFAGSWKEVVVTWATICDL